MSTPVYSGYTEAELSGAFDLVRPASNWKLAISAQVPADADTSLISAAVVFYTGSHAEFVPTGSGLRVLAAGYYACIGA
jgi:hypothetical protein